MKKIINKKLPTFLGIIILVLIIVIAFLLTNYVRESMKKDEQENLLLRAGMIALMLDRDRVRDLDGNASDTEKPSYTSLKRTLEHVRALNSDSRFIYIMGLDEDDQQFFMVDSEPSNSPDFSGPGDLYLDATESDIYNHKAGISYTDGPYTDSWGEWFSAYAPILGKNKEVLGMVGIDVAAERMLLRINIVQQAIFVIFSLLFYITLLFVLTRRRILT